MQCIQIQIQIQKQIQLQIQIGYLRKLGVERYSTRVQAMQSIQIQIQIQKQIQIQIQIGHLRKLGAERFSTHAMQCNAYNCQDCFRGFQIGLDLVWGLAGKESQGCSAV